MADQMEIVSGGAPFSRRKQLRPARVAMNRIKKEIRDESPTRLHSPLAYSAGEVIGPVCAERVADPLAAVSQPSSLIATMVDITGSAAFFRVPNTEEGKVLCRLRPTSSIEEANVVVLQNTESSLRLVVVRNVEPNQELTAIFLPSSEAIQTSFQLKKHPCQQCLLASFNSLDNLRAHQRLYCQRSVDPASPNVRNLEKNDDPTRMGSPHEGPVVLPALGSLPPSSLPSGIAAMSNVLMLPVAFHTHEFGQNIIQLLGPPQTVIPIAVSRQHPLPPPLLLVNRSFCGSLPIPSSLTLSVADFKVNIPIRATADPPTPLLAPVAVPLISPPQMRPPESSKCIPSFPPSSSLHKRPATNTFSYSPVDLSSKKAKKADSFAEKEEKSEEVAESSSSSSTSSSSATATASSSASGKPFACSCGVSFSAETTLLAHQTLYCRNIDRGDSQVTREQRKVPPTCPHCHFVPGSLSQLSVHIRNNHAQAYVCKKCGYRGFSLRGIRTHLRTHSELDSIRLDSLLSSHVSRMPATGGSRSVSPTQPSELSLSPDASLQLVSSL